MSPSRGDAIDAGAAQAVARELGNGAWRAPPPGALGIAGDGPLLSLPLAAPTRAGFRTTGGTDVVISNQLLQLALCTPLWTVQPATPRASPHYTRSSAIKSARHIPLDSLSPPQGSRKHTRPRCKVCAHSISTIGSRVTAKALPLDFTRRSRATGGSASRCRRNTAARALVSPSSAHDADDRRFGRRDVGSVCRAHETSSASIRSSCLNGRTESALAATPHRRPRTGVFRRHRPDSGLDTTRLKTLAVRSEGGYRVSDAQIWTSTAQVSTRSCCSRAPRRSTGWRSPPRGSRCVYTDLDRSASKCGRSTRWGRKAVDSNCFSSTICTSAADGVGDEGPVSNTSCTDSIPTNPRRGRGRGAWRAALERAGGVRTHAHRVRSSHRPQPSDPASPVPLLDGIEAANLMVSSSTLYDGAKPRGLKRTRQVPRGEACFKACETAVMVLRHGCTPRSTTSSDSCAKR